VALRFGACRSTILVPNCRELAAQAVKGLPDLDTPEAIDTLARMIQSLIAEFLEQETAGGI